MFHRLQVVDCRGHILGRLASVVAKELLCGQRVCLVRCEDIVLNGPMYRNKMKFMAFLRKSSNSNPRKCSQIHYRSPSRIIRRTIRGMMRHKLARGTEAMGRLTTFEGVPPSYNKKVKVVVPDALRIMKIRPERKVTRLGDLSSQVGWKYDDVVQRLEAKRLANSQVWAEDKAAERKALAEAEKKATAELTPAEQQVIAQFGC